MLAQYLDLTDEFNANGLVKFETSSYDYAVVQIVGQGQTIYFNTTIDSGAIQGVTDGSILTSGNYYNAYATQLSDGTLVSNSSVGGDGLYRINVVGRYIRLGGGPEASATKILVMLTKIS
jgi:hypothetical protein